MQQKSAQILLLIFITKPEIQSYRRINPMSVKRSRTLESMRSSGEQQNKKRKPQATIYRYGFWHRLFFRNQVYKVNGPESESFNRRKYQVPIQSLTHLTNDTLGFTNQILCQMIKRNHVKLFIPVYVSLKIKRIQQITLGQLSGHISSILIIYINIQGLPVEIVEHLKEHVLIQINRGQNFALRESQEDGKVTLKEKKGKLYFLIRENLPVQIYDDVFLSPFEILNLALTVTFNSTRLEVDETFQSRQRVASESKIRSYDSNIEDNRVLYEISFNSMRIPLEIPITYSQQCRLGVYDLAEQLLDYYPSNKASYMEVIQKFQDFLLEEESNTNQALAKQRKQMKEARQKAKKSHHQLTRHAVPHNFSPPEHRLNDPLQIQHSQAKKSKGSAKIKYFQYTHFVVPLYKIPGNAWATIFIPTFMLSLLSIFIFLQTDSSIGEKLGSIATFVLGFIALIPSIKAELPPSNRIAFSQIIVYIESINCMLVLLQQFFDFTGRRRFTKIWKNPLFIFSMTVHAICLISAVGLLILHNFVWIPRYNLKDDTDISSPETDYKGWNNPYCDETFLKYNNDMRNDCTPEKQIYPWPPSNFEKIKQGQILQKMS